MFNLRSLKRFVYRNIVDEGGGGGGAPAAVESPAPADASPPAVEAPKSMLDAISQSVARDELGRFTAKTPETPATPAAVAAQPAVTPAAASGAAPAAPAAKVEDDITAMPEGLGQKAQERFQRLASANRDLTERFEAADRQVSYIRDTFQQHSIGREQFEAAAGVIGMMNRGDYRGALKVIDQQRAQIALALGEPLPNVDPLESHHDLRQAVDAMEISEARALEIAGLRSRNQAVQMREQQALEQQTQSQAAQQAVLQAQTAIDVFCKRKQAEDIDYPAIEDQLVKALPRLLEGVPPARWAAITEAQYDLLRNAAKQFRPTAPAVDTNPLRATGAASPRQAPASLHEAMWGSSQRA